MVKNKDEKKKKIRMRPCVQLPYLNPFFFFVLVSLTYSFRRFLRHEKTFPGS